MKQRPFDKLVVPQLVNKFTFYSSRKLIAVFTTARHCHQAHKAASCRPSYIFEIHFNIILPLMSRTSKWSLSFSYPHQTLYILLFSPILVTRPVCFILHHVITLITCCEDYKSWSSSLRSFRQSAVTFCISRSDCFVSSPFSAIIQVRSLIRVLSQGSSGQKHQ
jgi:hypothetical protein